VANPLPAFVPAQYQNWVNTAASRTGLPANVVAYQIEDESGYNPKAVSSAGAEGIAQELPSTYSDYAKHGSPFNTQDALNVYVKLTNANLKWAGGDVAQALAAYNAGQGNWQAGTGYADTILSEAGESSDLKASGKTPITAQATGFNPSSVVSWFLNLFGAGSDIKDLLQRFGLIVFGGLILIVGLVMIAQTQRDKIRSVLEGKAPSAPGGSSGEAEESEAEEAGLAAEAPPIAAAAV
jgi:Transglycosylase SLT domain